MAAPTMRLSSSLASARPQVAACTGNALRKAPAVPSTARICCSGGGRRRPFSKKTNCAVAVAVAVAAAAGRGSGDSSVSSSSSSKRSATSKGGSGGSKSNSSSGNDDEAAKQLAETRAALREALDELAALSAKAEASFF